MIQLGSLQRWKKKDLLLFTGTAFHRTVPEDFLIDAKAAAALCAVSRPMFYKMNQQGVVRKSWTGSRWDVRIMGKRIVGGKSKWKTKREYSERPKRRGI